MNNIERLFWLSGFILLAFFCIHKINYAESLELLDRNNQLSHRLQVDQINELTSRLNEVKNSGYEQGFQAGESHALITSLDGKNLYDYADGYHAALLQFTNKKESNINQDTYDLFHTLLEMLDNSDSSYNELLDSFSDGN